MLISHYLKNVIIISFLAKSVFSFPFLRAIFVKCEIIAALILKMYKKLFRIWIGKRLLKVIVNLSSYGKKRILILYENSHYITPYKKNCFFLNIYFSFYHNISVLFHFRCRRCILLFNCVLFAQENLKELILLCMDYDVALRLKNIES